MANIWDDEERVSEYDLIAEDAEQAEQLAEEYASNVAITEASEEDLQEIVEESSFELNKREANVIYNARLRLEQAKLYEMLINHNLFDGVEASPEAIANVQNELKFYIVKRLEILLGIRQQVVNVQKEEASESQLNEVEIDFLKQLAYKGTLGASAKTSAPTTKESQAIKPVSAANTNSGLKPLRSNPALKKTVAKTETVQPEVAPAKKEVVKKEAPAPQVTQKRQVVKKEKPALKIRESGLGRTLTEQEAELIAREELAKNPPKKPFHEMTAKEKAARIKEVNEKYKRPAVTGGAVPMPSENELTMKYMTQQAQRSNSKNATDQFNVILANALAVKKTRGEQNDE